MTRLGCAMLVAAGCLQTSPEVDPLALDEAAFRCRVEPMLARRCAYPACHGDRRRPFRVYAPNRLRLGLPGDSLAAPLSPEEHQANFEIAAALAPPAAGYGESLLVVKPLSAEVGGAYHGGAEQFGGGDVFDSPDDPELGLLRAWIAGAAEDPSCAP